MIKIRRRRRSKRMIERRKEIIMRRREVQGDIEEGEYYEEKKDGMQKG